LRELQTLCERLGVRVRTDRFAPNATRRGGLCVLRGERVVMLDESLPILDKIGVLVEVLRSMNMEPLCARGLFRMAPPALGSRDVRDACGRASTYRPLARALRVRAADPPRKPSGER
jgi:hypothetical protein